jgi:hypothetical protein
MANNKKAALQSEIDQATNLHDYQFNTMKLDSDLQAELEASGFEWRFINLHHLKRNGFHKSYWKPYQRKAKGGDSASVASRIFGEDPDGFVIRGDSILAIKTKQDAESFRNILKRRNEILSLSAKPSEQLKKLRDQVDQKSMKFAEVGDDE